MASLVLSVYVAYCVPMALRATKNFFPLLGHKEITAPTMDWTRLMTVSSRIRPVTSFGDSFTFAP